MIVSRDSVVNVLFVEDDAKYANLLTKRMRHQANPAFRVEHVSRLDLAIEHLKHRRADVILLDLSLPDSRGLETLTRIHLQAPDVPVVVSTGLDDEESGVEAVERGAEDYLIKGRSSSQTVLKALRYALERGKQRAALKNLSLTDELTKLYNRRGFMALAQHQIELTRRTNAGFLLFFIDLDNFKIINDTYGHAMGDQALIDFANILKETFRESDVLARLGGDEFAGLAIQVQDSVAMALIDRLHKNIEDYHLDSAHPFRLSVSAGVEKYEPGDPRSVDELLSRADDKMYASKAQTKSGTVQRKRKILIIEDDDTIVKFLTYRFSRLGFDVSVAFDGEDGFAKAHQELPDLVILDLGLPKMSGEAVCKAIRENSDKKFAATPIIMLTGKDSIVDRVIGKVIGANCYMIKPFRMNDLIVEINRWLDPKRGSH